MRRCAGDETAADLVAQETTSRVWREEAEKRPRIIRNALGSGDQNIPIVNF